MRFGDSKFTRSIRFGMLAALVGLCMVPAAQAGFVGNAVTVNVSTSSDAGSWTTTVTPTTDPFNWSLIGGPVNILGSDNETVLATITNLSISLDGDPQAFVVFGVVAGGAPTNFSIQSALVAFAPLINPQATASGQLGITDLNANGAIANGNFAGGTKAFEARYNGANVFADLVTTPINAPPTTSNGANETFPPVGTVPIAGAVSNIQVEFNFQLSAGDLASGSGVFTVVPEPSAIVLAAMGCVGAAIAIYRRRRK